MKTHEQFVKDLAKINPDIKIIGRYKGCESSVKCKCVRCGYEWNGLAGYLLHLSGCPQCHMSSGERILLRLLDEFNITYTYQYSTPECKYINMLRFDAFDTVNNVAFEYNGEQHYFPVDYKHEGYNPIEAFKINQIRDNVKIEYCKNNNIPLIIIPYWEKNNMRNFLLNEFQKKGIYC